MYTSMLFRWKLYDLLCIGGGKLCIAEVLLINRNPQELSPYMPIVKTEDYRGTEWLPF